MVDASVEVERGREAYAGQAWLEAFESLSAADRSQPLGPADLELLATSAYMIGHEAEYLGLLERAHRAYLDTGDPVAALRSAFWIGGHFAQRGEMARASGWLGRAQRLLDEVGADRVERGYLLIPKMFEHEARGELEEAAQVAAEAAAVAERFGDRDLFALAAHSQGHMLIADGRIGEGLALLDEAMVAASSGELSPIPTGLVYCGVILACQIAREVQRAREWTAALSRWCEAQPDLVAFTGRCLVHRAEIMQLGGMWASALEEARRAHERALQANNETGAGEASYRQGEIHRLLGEHAAADRAYREASRHGRDPQPGLALLRLADGDREAALAAISRVLAETDEAGSRLALLPAAVEIMLAAGELDDAREACVELERLVTVGVCAAVDASLAHAQGAVELAGGDPRAALPALRRAAELWQELDAPYELARTRELIGVACRTLGDGDAATLELDAAREALGKLEAATDLVRLEALAGTAGGVADGLTERELQVLRMVAAGDTNRSIAAELVLSVRTVDRHVSNIFAKLGVSSRAAAASYAHEHRLL